MASAVDLLAVHDRFVRDGVDSRFPPDWVPTRQGPVLWVRTPHRGFIFSDGLPGMAVAQVREHVEAARGFFAGHREPVEWKTYGNDNPALVPALRAAGFVAEPTETVVIAESATMAVDAPIPAEVTIRRVVADDDMRRIADMESAVWGDDRAWLADDLIRRVAWDPDNIRVYAAEAGGAIVCAGWLVVVPGTPFAGLWGGSTLEQWRGRGIYRALVSRRAQEAVERGVGYLWVDASDESSPILQRLGMQAVTTTTPWIWEPSRP